MNKILTYLLIFLLFTSSYAIAASDDILRLALPDHDWALEMDFKNFELQDQGFLPDFKGRKVQAKNAETGLIISAFLVPAEKPITAEEYRDMNFKGLENSPFKLSNIKKNRKGDKAFVEYLIKDYKEVKNMNQKNIYVYLIKDDVWIDVHLSKVDFKEEDKKIFNSFIDSINLKDNFIPSSYDNFLFGSYFYNYQNYKKAALYYKRALDQEKKKPALSDELWTVLVDNLAIAYGISGDLSKSKETLEYGLSQKPQYPMFYYNLACMFAESDDLDSAIKNLSKAFEYKGNMLKGESIPDPAKDLSFKKYLKDKRFMDFLAVIK